MQPEGPSSLLIRGGDIVTADETYTADILCEGETIAAIGEDLPAPDGAEVIDATGKYVFPGFVDPHVHIHLPFMGTHAKDDYASGSRAALAGGTTTLIEMVCPARDDEPLDALELWMGKAAGVSACDYSFHMGVTRFDAGVEAQLREIVADEGITSFKVFLAYKGAFGISDAELYGTLKLAAELGVTVTAHCENAELIAGLQAELLAAGKTGPEWHEPSRPAAVEAEGCHHLMSFAEFTGASVYVVHTSNRPAVENILAARERGVDAKIEVVVPHLLLDKSYAERPGFEGAKYVMSPPLRDRGQGEFLWRALADGSIDTVATDHAPFDFEAQKRRLGEGDFTKIPNGIPGVEDRVNLLYTHGVAAGRIDLNTFVRAASTEAAKTFGLYPKKGAIAAGADADLVVYDPDYRGTISAVTQQMNVDYSAYEGWEICGRPALVTVRGEVAARDGVFVGTPGRGRLLRRRPVA